MTEKVVLTVNEGKIRGVKKKSKFSGAEFYSFYGIPYGQPTGNRARYKDPVKVKPWKNIYDATVQRDGCSQFAFRVSQFVGSEDCLYNNIHTPKIESEGEPLRAVIVCIHPGAFFNGTPDPWYYGSPDFVMQHNIVYVCIGYRLHLLGFLNLGLQECSGNQGLKDIILGLKWIKDNIKTFGGDPENVTLLGSSSGGMLVHCLMLSPAAKGLFHKAIIMGMYAFNTVRVCREENSMLAMEAAQLLGYDGLQNDDKKKLLSFLKKIPIESILLCKIEKSQHKDSASSFPCSPFSPTIDRGENSVLPTSLRKLIDSTTRVPLIIGICEKEGIAGFCQGLKKITIENFKQSFRQNCWGWAHHMADDQLNAMHEKIKSFYLQGGDLENAPLSVLVDIQTDAAFSDLYDTLINVISADLPSSVYVYKFEYESNDNLNTFKEQISLLLDQPIEGTFHGSDYSYWASTIDECSTNNGICLTDKTRKTIETFTKFLTTFAKTGDPNYQDSTVRWRPSTVENPCYLSINETLNLVDGELNDERMKFWQYLKATYGTQEVGKNGGSFSLNECMD